jgi:hypothetical protein
VAKLENTRLPSSPATSELPESPESAQLYSPAPPSGWTSNYAIGDLVASPGDLLFDDVSIKIDSATTPDDGFEDFGSCLDVEFPVTVVKDEPCTMDVSLGSPRLSDLSFDRDIFDLIRTDEDVADELASKNGQQLLPPFNGSSMLGHQVSIDDGLGDGDFNDVDVDDAGISSFLSSDFMLQLDDSMMMLNDPCLSS